MRSLALALCLLPTLTIVPIPALAEGFTRPVADPALSSPFAFAKSGQKAARALASAKAGESAGARVIGGQIAAEGAWPWQVALMVAGAPETPDGQFCGGSLILDTWVMTAAHCVHMQGDDGTYADIDPAQIAVLVGTNELAPGKGDLVPVKAVFRHPDYVGTGFDHDIALVQLARAPTAPFATVHIPDAAFGDLLDQPGVVTLVTGWGLTEGGSHPDALHQAEIQMMDRNMCNATLMDARAEEAGKAFGYAVEVFGVKDDDAYALWDQLRAKAPEPMSENFLCSGTFEGGKTACSGDSGGPLVVALEDGSYIQAGVVSWGLSGAEGKGCNEAAPFSAYTRVSNFVPWLEATVSANP